MVKSDRRCLPQERRRDVVGIRRRRRSLGQLVSLFATLCTADATACVTAPAEARIRLFGSALAATILLSAGVSRASGEGASADQVAANAQEGRRESSTRTQALPETLEFSTSPSSVTHGVRRAPMRGEGPQSSSGGFCTDAGGRTRCDPEELESDGVPRKDDGDGGVVGPDGNLDGNQPGEERKRLQEISEDLEGFSSIEACPARDEPPRKGDGLSECAGIRAEEEEPGVGARFIVRWHDFFTIGQHGELLCRALGCPAGDGEDPASGTRSEEATRRCEVGDVRAHSRGLCSGCVPSPFESRDEDTVAGEGVLGSRGSAVPDAPGGNHTPASSQGVSISPHRVSPCGDGGALPQDGYSWALLRRENPATLSYPSDFSTVVVRPDDGGCGGGYQEENGCKSDGPSGERGFDGRAGCGTGILGTRFLEALERSPLVKSVHSDKIYHRGPSSEEGRLRGGHEDGVGVPLNGWQEIGVGDWPEREELVYLPMERLHLGSPGRRGDSIDLGADDGLDGGENRQRRDSATGRRLKSKAGAGGNSGTRLRGVHKPFVNAGRRGLWLHEQGFLGAGVRVAVFDTGLDPGDHDFDNVVERINWTNERTLVDHEGHGTHVAGVIGGRDPTCPGFAPDAELYIFRVFASRQVSYTSWFLDAFNYALFLGIDVINLSSGGPDFRDQPFVDKVRELSANGILLVSAVGNDGPLFGTQHNPADQADTIGVGALAADESRVASFQSRGMTTWELPAGYGRVKPDVLAVGEKVLGPKAGGKKGECSGRTGTSVASPVVAGAVALLASTVPMERRSDIVNPASMKQVLVESARRLPGAGMFEQGAGALHIEEAYHALRRYTPRASLIPPKLDFEEPYMWPFAYQPLYHGARPTMFNFTVVNGMGVTGCIRNVTWAEDGLDWSAASEGGPPGTLELKAEYPEVLWPWSGYLAVSLSVTRDAPDYPKVVTGTLKVVVESEAGTGEGKPRVTVIDVPVAVKVVRTPPRERRLLWDQFHSLAYPSAFVPRDFLDSEGDMLDRKGDHPHTNFRSLWESLVGAGYFVEVLGADWTCFDAENYGALLMVDLEDELGEGEKIKLEEDVYEKGLSLVVFADWYSEDVMSRIRFFDDNTRVRWEPITGGSNVPALNEFLMRFGMALGGQVFDGVIPVNPGREISFASGNALARAPPGSLVLRTDAITRAFPAALEERPGDRLEVSLPNERASLTPSQSRVVALGALDTARLPRGARGSFEDTPSGGAGKPPTSQAHGGGRLFLMGDSSCADDAYLKPLDKSRSGRRSDCLWLFRAAVQYACEGVKDAALFGMAEEAGAGYSDGLPLPSRTASNELFKYSRVIGDDSKDLPSAAGDRCEARDWKKVKRAPSEKAAS